MDALADALPEGDNAAKMEGLLDIERELEDDELGEGELLREIATEHDELAAADSELL